MIIDTHAHIGNMILFNMTEEELVYSVNKYNIDFTLVSSIEAAEFDHQGVAVPQFLQKPQNVLLEKLLKVIKRHPNKLGALVFMKCFSEQPDAETERIIAENREYIYGIKLHPFHSRTAPDDPKLEPVYRLAAKFSLPVVSHTGGCAEAESIRLYNAAKAHPELDFVMVHMDLGTDNSKALELLRKLPNLYGDTTWVPLATTLKAIELYGSEKMLFGTDNPIDGKDTLLHNRTGERSLYQQYFNEAKALLSPEAYDDLMYKSAARLFKIKLKEEN